MVHYNLPELISKHKFLIEKFRDIFKNEPLLPNKSDSFLLRWLMARNFDLEKAEKMLRDTLLWRKQNRIGYIPEDYSPSEVLVKYQPVGIISYDDLGNPIFLARCGRWDVRGFLEATDQEEIITYWIQVLEKFWPMKTNYQDEEIQFRQITAILDLKDCGMRQVTGKNPIQVLLQVFKTLEYNYPEFLQKIIVINAPMVFDFVFSLVKPILSERTLKKIAVFGNNPNIWKPALLADIPAGMIPVSYGGTLTDPVDGNPHCSSLVNMGCDVPKSYYLVNQQKNPIKSDKNGFIVVNNRSKKVLEILVEKNQTLLQWEFESKDGDVAFCVTQKIGQVEKVVLPRARVDCHISKIEGEILCTDAASYFFEFDNTFSYWKSKRICYAIKLKSGK